MRLLRSDAQAERENGVDIGTIATNILVQRLTAIEKAQRVGEHGIAIRIKGSKLLPIAVTILGDVEEIRKNLLRNAVAAREERKGVSEQTAGEVDGGSISCTDGNFPCRYGDIATRRRVNDGIRAATSIGSFKQYSIDACNRRTISTRRPSVATGVAIICSTRARKLLRTGGNGTCNVISPAGVTKVVRPSCATRRAGGAVKRRSGRDRLIGLRAETLRVIDADVAGRIAVDAIA